ncbi:MAG: FtsX-like permease family protein [Gammaproteobacteria bacterium]|nr:FtsX-like permease family protein [Gammaproteobacteria bacterium]
MGKIFTLAFLDYRHEWRMSLCLALALAAVLAPLLVLFGLKFGIVSGMLEQLIENPRNREVRIIGSAHLAPYWFKDMQARSDVAFLVPKTRSLAATIKLTSRQSRSIVSTELVPTGKGDPLLQQLQIPLDIFQVVLTEAVAQRLRVAKGSSIQGSLSRQYLGRRERAVLDLQVVDIVPAAVFARKAAFVSLELLTAAEDYRDGRAVESLGWQGKTADSSVRYFPGFRLYATSIYDVKGLQSELLRRGLDVRTNAGEVDTVLLMDRNLSLVFWIIAVVGLLGFSLSLGASLWANVNRKKRDLSVLRLVGFRSGDIIAFPLFQSLFTGLFGWLAALLIYLAVEETINHLMKDYIQQDQSVCYLLPEHFLIALVITLSSAFLAAILGGYRASKLEPSDGLRDI